MSVFVCVLDGRKLTGHAHLYFIVPVCGKSIFVVGFFLFSLGFLRKVGFVLDSLISSCSHTAGEEIIPYLL